MGLDSIELIIEFEKFFKAKIEDREAEKIGTLQETVDLVCQKLQITTKRCLVFNEFYRYILEQLIIFNYVNANISADDNILEFINLKDKEVIQQLQQDLELEVDVHQPFSFPFWHVLANKKEAPITLLQFIEGIAILNFYALYPNKYFASQQEIYLGVAMVTYHKAGVSVYELGLDKSFTNDLGID